MKRRYDPFRKEEPMPMTLTRYRCPNTHCTWYRDYDPARDDVIEHITYGLKMTREIASLEIRGHSCEAHAKAAKKAKLMRRWYLASGRKEA